MRKHYVTFVSPGTLFAEMTSKPIDAWDIKQALALEKGTIERYGAKPFGFYFSTRLVVDPVPDGEGGTLNVEPREVERSGMHFLADAGHWSLHSYDELERVGSKETEILRSNMRGNGWPIVFESRRSFRCTQPFEERDVVVDDKTGDILVRGDEPEKRAYRDRMKLAGTV